MIGPGFSVLLVLVLWFQCTLAAPLASEPLSTKRAAGTLEELTQEFKGIHWDLAFLECPAEQLDKMIFTARAAEWIFDLVGRDGKYAYSKAWSRYFFNYRAWNRHGYQYSAVAAGIQRT